MFDDATSRTKVSLVGTLLDTSDGWTPGAFDARTYRSPFLSVTSKAIKLKVVGYQGDVARCCPNVSNTLTWTWNGRSFTEIHAEPKHGGWGRPGTYMGY